MNLLRKLALYNLMGMALLLALVASSNAGVENLVADEVSFEVTYDWAEIDSTTDDRSEQIGTVKFQVQFDEASTGYLQGATIRLLYNPDYLDLIDARPVAGWGSVNATPIEEAVDGLMKVTYIIDPAPGASSIPIQTTLTDLAEFDFIALCQPGSQTNEVQIVYLSASTTVDDGVDQHYVTMLERATAGWIRTSGDNTYQFDIAAYESDQIEFKGALGTQILVPIYALTNFRLGDISMQLSYDNTKLNFLGLANWDGYFSNAQYTLPQTGLVSIDLTTDESIHPRHEFADGTKLFDLRFYVAGSWEGNQANIIFANLPTVSIAQGSGTCDEAGIEGVAPVDGSVFIPAYTAEYSSTFPDAQGSNVSIADNTTTVQVNLTNNYPAGRTRIDDDPYVIANLMLQTGLTPTVANPPDFWMWTTGDATGTQVTMRLKNTGRYFGASETPQSVASFVVAAAVPTSFDAHLLTVRYQTPYDGLSTGGARVRDTTGRVTATQANTKLSWDTTQVNYLMGEYYCPSVQAGSGLISQNYYTRSSFDLHDFRVKISVSGNHSMYDVALEPGVVVEELDSAYFKWIIIKSGDEWTDQPTSDTRFKFATITYAYWTQSHMLELSQPGNGHWVTKSSYVTFDFASPGYYMKDSNDNDQHKVALGGSVVSRWWVNDDPIPDPDPDPLNWLAGPDGLPKEFALLQNYPNPFNPTTEFWYALPEGAYVELSVYNITGQKVAILDEGWREPGFYRQSFNGDHLASGVYFYRLVTDKFTQSKKMLMVK